ncbi:GntG family PLP-dependent aldolase [Micromonospora sp. BRA006-A]|nr:GntG family PLP-dependent aldolase [Micromonospora sp. BRA006-A]
MTRPTPGMREAMAAAEVGDDVYGEDPTVIALETEVAALFGHEAALFAPSGSMANQIALQLHVPPGDELLCDADAHVVTYEVGAAAAYGGISSRTWPAVGRGAGPRRGRRDDPAGRLLRGAHAGDRRGADPQPGRRRVIPLPTLRRMREVADEHGVALHCDGARIWHAHVADGVPLAEYGVLFDTLSVCLSKGLGAPVGSLVVGSAEKIARARFLRKRMGGGMRQVGIPAAAGRYALAHHVERLADDHVKAARLAEAVAPHGVLAAVVRTNIVPLDLTKHRWTRTRWRRPRGRRGC